MTTGYIATYNYITEDAPVLMNPGGFNPDYPGTNAMDGLTWSQAQDVALTDLTFEFDLGGPKNVTCYGLAGHNMQLDDVRGARFILDWSDDGNTWNETSNVVVPTHNAMFVAGIPGFAHRYWRVAIRDSGPSEQKQWRVGALWLGDATPLPVGISPSISPPYYNQNNRLLRNFGGGGAILGTGVLWQGGQTTYVLDQLTWAEIESDTWRDHYERIAAGKPFFLSWDNSTELHQNQAGYCVAPETPTISYDSHGRASLTIAAQTV